MLRLYRRSGTYKIKNEKNGRKMIINPKLTPITMSVKNTETRKESSEKSRKESRKEPRKESSESSHEDSQCDQKHAGKDNYIHNLHNQMLYPNKPFQQSIQRIDAQETDSPKKLQQMRSSDEDYQQPAATKCENCSKNILCGNCIALRINAIIVEHGDGKNAAESFARLMSAQIDAIGEHYKSELEDAKEDLKDAKTNLKKVREELSDADQKIMLLKEELAKKNAALEKSKNVEKISNPQTITASDMRKLKLVYDLLGEFVGEDVHVEDNTVKTAIVQTKTPPKKPEPKRKNEQRESEVKNSTNQQTPPRSGANMTKNTNQRKTQVATNDVRNTDQRKTQFATNDVRNTDQRKTQFATNDVRNTDYASEPFVREYNRDHLRSNDYEDNYGFDHDYDYERPARRSDREHSLSDEHDYRRSTRRDDDYDHNYRGDYDNRTSKQKDNIRHSNPENIILNHVLQRTFPNNGNLATLRAILKTAYENSPQLKLSADSVDSMSIGSVKYNLATIVHFTAI